MTTIVSVCFGHARYDGGHHLIGYGPHDPHDADADAPEYNGVFCLRTGVVIREFALCRLCGCLVLHHGLNDTLIEGDEQFRRYPMG